MLRKRSTSNKFWLCKKKPRSKLRGRDLPKKRLKRKDLRGKKLSMRSF